MPSKKAAIKVVRVLCYTVKAKLCKLQIGGKGLLNPTHQTLCRRHRHDAILHGVDLSAGVQVSIFARVELVAVLLLLAHAAVVGSRCL